MIERILVPGIMEPVSHYCHVVRAGPHVWVSGVVGMDGNGNIPEDVVAQFDLAIDVMDQCLKAAGAGAEHVVKVQVFLTDITSVPRSIRAGSPISATTARHRRWSRSLLSSIRA